jgi:peptidoglycan biosynthesis protein MviN/MurJ (putative lipid II flippase)
MIPALGLFGAALATAIANVAISLLQLYELRELEGITTDLAYYKRTLLAACVPTLGVLWLTGWVLPSTGPLLGYSPWLLRGALATFALGLYFALQLCLPGRRPWGGSHSRPRAGL